MGESYADRIFNENGILFIFEDFRYRGDVFFFYAAVMEFLFDFVCKSLA